MLYNESDFVIRTKALQEAIRLCDSAIKLSMLIKITPSFLSKLLHDSSTNISYDLAFTIEKELGISIERLMPDKKELNSYVEKRMFSRLMLREFSKNVIITTNSPSLTFLQDNRFIIIGTDGVLISGLAILNDYSGDKIKALPLDLVSIINKFTSLEWLLHKLLISERIAIGLRLEQLIGNRQGQRNTNNQSNTKYYDIRYEIYGRTDMYIARIIGFSKDTYIRGKLVYLSNNQKLINAIDNKTISIGKAVQSIGIKQL